MSTVILVTGFLLMSFVCSILLFRTVHKTRGNRRSVESLVHLLQNVNEYKEDLELAVNPSKQEALKTEWLNDVCRSQVCYRRDVSRLLDVLQEYYGRMRRNAIAVLETMDGEAQILRKIQGSALQEAQRKLVDLQEIIELLIGEGMEAENAAKFEVLANGFANFMKRVRFSGGNRESVAPMIQNLMRRSQELMGTIGAEFADNEDVKGIVNALTDTAGKLLNGFVLLNQNLEVYLKLSDLADGASKFLRAVWWPLVLAGLWSRVPLERWQFIPVPTLSRYGQSRGVNVLASYQQMKSGVVRMANLLYPGFPVIAERIESTM